MKQNINKRIGLQFRKKPKQKQNNLTNITKNNIKNTFR